MYRVIMGGSSEHYEKPELGVQAPQDDQFCGVGVVVFLAIFCISAGEKRLPVTLCVNCLDGSKESCKVRIKKYALQFTASEDMWMLKMVLGLTITVSTRNGFPTALK
jgi:hypothetical protein